MSALISRINNIPGSKDDNSTGVLFETGTHGSHSASLGRCHWHWSQTPQLIVLTDIGNGNLGKQAGLVHDGHRLDGVVALGRLTRQHDAVGTVEDGIANIADLGTSRTRIVGHGLQHLRGTDDRLASNVALRDHHLLCDEHLRRRDLNTKVTTSNHHTIRLLQNFVKVVDTLLVFDLGDDLDVLAILAEDLTNRLDITSCTNERSEDHVHPILDAKSYVVLVLLGEWWEVNVGLGQVDTLAGGDLAIVLAAALQGLVVNDLEDFEGENTVIDEDDLALLNDLGDVLVVDIPRREDNLAVYSPTSRFRVCPLHVLVVASCSILFICGYDDLVAGANVEILVVDRVTRSDLWPFLFHYLVLAIT